MQGDEWAVLHRHRLGQPCLRLSECHPFNRTLLAPLFTSNFTFSNFTCIHLANSLHLQRTFSAPPEDTVSLTALQDLKEFAFKIDL